MLSPLNGNEPRTRPTPASRRSQDASFEVQRRELNLRHDREALAAERQQLAQERRQLEREKQTWTELQEQRVEQHAVEQRTEQRRTEATALAADLAHDVDGNRPNHMAGLILAAAAKAKGGQSEPLTGMAAAIVRSAKLAAGEIASEPALPENLAARAIVLSGKRAAGEALSAADAEWLATFARKLDDDSRR